MKNKLIIFIGIIVLALIAFFGNVISSNPKELATETSDVDLKNGDIYNLTASYVKKEISGEMQKMLAYNGSIPGPTIRVKQGDGITINLKNNTDLPQLLHSHGVRMDYKFDGSQMVQEEILPGESFAYKLKFPDAGIYWYHPHAGESYAQPLGLYGAFVVTPEDPNYFPKVDREDVLMFSSLPILNGKINLEYGDHSNELMGSFGNTQLINGKENYTLQGKSGEVRRLNVLNTASARPLNFAIKGLQMKLVGGDSGVYEKATFIDEVLLGPSERAIVDVYFENVGQYKILNKTPSISYEIGIIDVSESKEDRTFSYVNDFKLLQTNIDTVKSIDPYRKLFSKEPDKKILLTMDLGMMGGMSEKGGIHGMHRMPDGSMMRNDGMMMDQTVDGIEWEEGGMNQMMGQNVKWKIVDQDSGKDNMDIMWDLKKDQPIKVRITNDKNSMHPMQHPIHFHGQRFLVVARDGKLQDNLVWKDTAFVKAGEVVDIILDTSNLGEWMAHCHISEHLENGMMFGFKVE